MGKVKVGIVGLGWFGRKHVSAWREVKNAEVVAGADARMTNMTTGKPASQSAFHAADKDTTEIDFPCYASLTELLRNQEVDVVDIVVDENNHFPVAQEALGKGLDVIVEKPFVTSYSHALSLSKLSEKNDARIFVGHILRFDERMRFIKARLESGQCGEIRYMSFKRNFQASAHLVYGRVNPVYSAMIHDIDLSLWFSKKKVVDEHLVSRHLLKRENPDVLLASLELEGDIVSRIENVWHVSKNCPYGFENEICVYCDKETIRSGNVPTVELWGENKVECPDFFFWPSIAGRRGGALKMMLDHYAECVRRKTASEVLPIRDVLEATRIAERLEKLSKEPR